MTLTGYLCAGYAESLSEFGTPRQLPRSGGWILTRAIPETSDHDASGCYPLFLCRDWTALEADVQDLVTHDLNPRTIERIILPWAA